MKINKTKSQVLRGGAVGAETSFSLNQSQHAFEILSSGLYTDSVNAIVRELSSNAYDSHRINGNADEPFEIHIPSTLEPYFSIRDFGTGLSPEDVKGLYSTYFETTKSASNDFIGGFGLGSKTPFSYTDNFQVTSYMDGTAYMFAVFVEDGYPKIAEMGSKDTPERNGLDVRISSSETERFVTAIEHFTAYFTVRPTIKNYSETMYDEDNVRNKSDSNLNDPDGEWMFASRLSGWGNDNKVGAIYGQVPYPVDYSLVQQQLEKRISEEALTMYKALAPYVVFLFDVGEISVTANREDMKYDDVTIKSFASKIKKLHKFFNDTVRETVENYEKNNSLTAIYTHLMDNVFPDSEYLGFIDYDSIDCPEFSQVKDMLGGYNKDYINRSINHIPDEIMTTIFKGFSLSYLKESTSRKTHENLVSVTSKLPSNRLLEGQGTQFQFIVVDEHRLGVAKAKQYALDNYDEVGHFVLIKADNKDALESVDYPQKIEAIRNWLLNPELLFVSNMTYTKPERVKSITTSSGKQRVVSGATYQSDYNISSWHVRDSSIDMEKGGVYVYVAGGNNVYFGSKAKPEFAAAYKLPEYTKTKALVTLYNDSKSDTSDHIETSDIIGVSAADIKLFDADENWTNIFDVIRPQATSDIERYADMNSEYFSLKSSALGFTTVQFSYSHDTNNEIIKFASYLADTIVNGDTLVDDFPNLAHTTLIKNAKLLAANITRRTELENYAEGEFFKTVKGLCTTNTSDIESNTSNPDYITSFIDNMIEDTAKAYPMMRYMNSVHTTELRLVLEYADMIETNKLNKG